MVWVPTHPAAKFLVVINTVERAKLPVVVRRSWKFPRLKPLLTPSPLAGLCDLLSVHSLRPIFLISPWDLLLQGEASIPPQHLRFPKG